MVFSVKRGMHIIAFFIATTPTVYALPSDYILNAIQENSPPKVKGTVNFSSVTKSSVINKTNQAITVNYSLCNYSTVENVACQYSSIQISPLRREIENG
ncbi:MAG: hypothetical protein LEGION0403_FIIPPAGN_02576 [Legionella sp.]